MHPQRECQFCDDKVFQYCPRCLEIEARVIVPLLYTVREGRLDLIGGYGYGYGFLLRRSPIIALQLGRTQCR